MTAPTKLEIKTFSLLIEDIACNKEISYMDAILLHCEDTGLEPEIAARLLSPIVKRKLQTEAENLNFLPKPKTRKLL